MFPGLNVPGLEKENRKERLEGAMADRAICSSSPICWASKEKGMIGGLSICYYTGLNFPRAQMGISEIGL